LHTNTIAGGFDTGPGFVFNLGGGPGVRVHQFGGGRPRRRPGTAQAAGSEPAPSFGSALSNLLPLLFLFVLPLLSSIFSGSSSSGPSFVFEQPRGHYTKSHVSNRLQINYFVNPADVRDYSQSDRRWRKLDEQAETQYVHTMQTRCQTEKMQRDQAMQNAQGWFFVDEEAMTRARNMELKNCKHLEYLLRKL
jgi:DnaJ family protein B protein 12